MPCTAPTPPRRRRSRLRISSRPSISTPAEAPRASPAHRRCRAAPRRPQTMNLLDLAREDLAAFFAARGEKPFRARQVSRWIHQRFVDDISAMTDLARPLRERLAAEAAIVAPTPIRDTVAADGTRKWLFDAGNGNAVEAVYIPEDDRGTLCVSSQAGCALDCAFCSTGKQGFNRNLTTGEIVGQLWFANRTLLADSIRAEGPPRGANSAPSGGSAAAKPQAWGDHTRAPITNVVM